MGTQHDSDFQSFNLEPSILAIELYSQGPCVELNFPIRAKLQLRPITYVRMLRIVLDNVVIFYRRFYLISHKPPSYDWVTIWEPSEKFTLCLHVAWHVPFYGTVCM